MPRQNNIQFRKGTQASWTTNQTQVLASGEPGFETDTLRLKIGNGNTAWSELNYVGLAGTGTSNFLAKFNGVQSVANSIVFDNGTNVGIGTVAPSGKLHVEATGVNVMIGPFNTWTGGGKLRIFGDDTDNQSQAIKAFVSRSSAGLNICVNGTSYTIAGGGSGTNIGMYAFAGNGNKNYAFYGDAGYNYFADRVGIGTLDPTTLLDVSGVITATGGNSTNWNTAYTHSQVTTGAIHGSSTVGTALFRIANNSTSNKFVRVNIDNTLSYRTGAEVLGDIGAYAATNPNGYTTNTGTVTGVTGTAPIVSSGGTAPAISISAATTSAAGSMSSADKTKLDGVENGAQVNTVTSVAGKTGAVTLTNSDVGLGNVVNVSALPLAGGTMTGAISFAAGQTWPPFNQNTTGTSAGVLRTVTGTNSAELVRCNMADNDFFRILAGGTASNAGYAEIATADDGTEPIYVRQYTGVFTALTRTATLLDDSGNTSFPGSVTANSFVKSGGTASQFLKANGTVDSTAYTTNTGTVTSVGGTGTVAGLTLTGTVTTTGSLTLGGTLSVSESAIANNAVTNAKAADMAVNTIKGRITAGTGDPEDLTATNVRTILSITNIDNTSDANKPVSTAQQTALNLKAPLASPTFTGTPAAPTATAGTNTTQLATTQFVRTEITSLVDAAPGTLDTLNELAAALGDDPNFATTVSTNIGTKVSKSGDTMTGALSVTSANNSNAGGAQIYLNGLNGNRIDFSIPGVAPPAFTTRSVGTKIVLYPNVGASTVDYAFGIDGGTLWQSVPNSSSIFRWYAGTTNIATLNGAGNLTASSFVRSGGTASQFLKADGTVDSTTYAATNQTMHIGTTAVVINRTSASQVLTGVSIETGGGVTTQHGDKAAAYVAQIAGSTAGLFPATDNSNSFLTLGRHPGNFYSQLGFSSNGNIYYRAFSNAAIDTTTAWQTVWTSVSLTNLNQLTNGPGYTTNTGTVTSVGGTGTVAGLTLTGTVTTTGSLTLGGTLSTPVATINDSTTVGQNLVKLTNPSAIRFLRINANNTVDALTDSAFRTAIGAGTSSTNGTVTSVAALTLGTTGTDVSSSVANGTTTPVITLSIPNASAVNRGALTSTDWSTFNNKANTNQTMHIGTTAVVINRASASLNLTGVSIDGNAGTVTNGVYSSSVTVNGNIATWGATSKTLTAGYSVSSDLSSQNTSTYIPRADAVKAYADTKQAAITGGASTITTNNLTASRALVSDGSGKVAVSDITNTELNYLDNASSNIQTQLNGKQATLTNPVTGTGTTNYISKWTGTTTQGNSIIFDNGNVGIGTTTPGNFRLRVPYSGGNYAPVEFNGPGTGAWGIGLVIRTTGGNDGAAILFRNRDTKNWQIRGQTSGTGFQITEDGGDANYGSDFGTPRVHISAGGNVGIGTTTPNYRLEVKNSSPFFYPNETGENAAAIHLGQYSTGYGQFLSIKTHDEITYRTSFLINRFIGRYRFSIGDPTLGEEHQAELRSGTGGNIWDLYNFNNEVKSRICAGTDHSYINGGGSLGIGTTSPGGNLSVVGSVESNQVALHVNNTAANGYSAIRLGVDSAVGSQINIHAFNSSWSGTGAFAPNAGNLSNTTGALTLCALNAAGTIQFYTAGTAVANERMRITNAGDVGIGTTTPLDKIHVSGAQTTIRLNNSLSYDTQLRLIDTASDWSVGINQANVLGSGVFSIRSITAGVSRLVINTTGDVGIGTATPSYKLQVNGSFAASTKSFRIDHPSRPNYTLEYGSLESPYHGVRLTGRGTVIKGSGTVLLPYYLKDLIHDDENINIQITNIKHGKTIYVDEIDLNNDRFTVRVDRAKSLGDLEFFWVFTGVRKDVDRLVVEREK